jgi:hypothetical protein
VCVVRHTAATGPASVRSHALAWAMHPCTAPPWPNSRTCALPTRPRSPCMLQDTSMRACNATCAHSAPTRCAFDGGFIGPAPGGHASGAAIIPPPPPSWILGDYKQKRERRTLAPNRGGSTHSIYRICIVRRPARSPIAPRHRWRGVGSLSVDRLFGRTTHAQRRSPRSRAAWRWHCFCFRLRRWRPRCCGGWRT